MGKMNIVFDYLRFLKKSKKYWLAPIVLMFLVLGLLIVLGNSSVVAPFIYALF
jgi:hypothetical protein